ncbi:50S ribosomal protein L25/general stress protein Ctc [Oceanobacillus indicireducens]|uniref:Large ribosomal subunit protein bL25 n=1 Tax=Oceanobacillus indicireducens TaxID=1004261 RepID=A0A918D3E7_9BACI|nr:50S ribosomal protein L25/general stress protein Ctc [Oceanobacillus indicireducens]GGN63502.1 50S ribosomal protein L25 [Oceanobacillus indicireducens]
MAIKLKALKRDDLSNSVTKQLRADGQVPAVVYGKDKDSKTVAVDSVELLKTVRDEGRNAIITLDVENGTSVDVMLHEYQIDPIKDSLIHVDFYVVDMSEEMEVSVPVRIEGEAAGAKEGGVMQQPQYEVLVNAKPANFPDEITVNVSELQIGDVITVEDLPASDKYEFVDEPDAVIVTIVPPTEEEPETQLPDDGAEPELVDAKESDEE